MTNNLSPKNQETTESRQKRENARAQLMLAINLLIQQIQEEQDEKKIAEYKRELATKESILITLQDPEKINDNVVKPVKITKSVGQVTFKLLAVGLLELGINIGEIAKNIVAPLGLAITGAVSAFQIFKNIRNKYLGNEEKRRNPEIRMFAAAINLLATGAALGVVILAASNPIGLAICAVGAAVGGLVKQSLMTREIRKAVVKAKNALAVNEDLLADIKVSDPFNIDRIKRLEENVNEAKTQLAKTKEERFERQRKNVFSGLTVAGCTLMLGGFLFPPIAAVGAVILAGSAVVEVVDKHYDYKLSKAVAQKVSDAGKALKSLWNDFKETVTSKKLQTTNEPQKTIKPSQESSKVEEKTRNQDAIKTFNQDVNSQTNFYLLKFFIEANPKLNFDPKMSAKNPTIEEPIIISSGYQQKSLQEQKPLVQEKSTERKISPEESPPRSKKF